MSPTATAPASIARLTAREVQIVSLVAEGWTTREIAGHLSRSVRSIEDAKAGIQAKLRARNMCNAVALAIHLHFLDK